MMRSNRKKALMWGALAVYIGALWLLPPWTVFVLLIAACIFFAARELRREPPRGGAS